jgi:hypothetical protein
MRTIFDIHIFVLAPHVELLALGLRVTVDTIKAKCYALLNGDNLLHRTGGAFRCIFHLTDGAKDDYKKPTNTSAGGFSIDAGFVPKYSFSVQRNLKHPQMNSGDDQL